MVKTNSIISVNIPNRLSILRIILAPLFYVLYFIPQWTGTFSYGSLVLIVILFIGMEITDVLDGYIARRQNLTSDIGKVLDPFSDVITRTTFFLCFTLDNIFPGWLFLIFLYREIGIIFIRLLLIRKGIALAARRGGKLKSLFYGFSGGAGLLYLLFVRLGFTDKIITYTRLGASIIFGIAVLTAVLSFGDYLTVFKKHKEKPES